MTMAFDEQSNQAVRRAFARYLRLSALFAVALAVLGGAVAGVIAGWPGVWGMLIGAALTAAFVAVTGTAGYLSADRSMGFTTAVVLGGPLVKIVIAAVVLLLLRDLDFFSTPALLVALLLGLVVPLAFEAQALTSARVGYVDTGKRST